MTKQEVYELIINHGHLAFGEFAEGEAYYDFAETLAQAIINLDSL